LQAGEVGEGEVADEVEGEAAQGGFDEEEVDPVAQAEALGLV
jgi:hypothetical protein